MGVPPHHPKLYSLVLKPMVTWGSRSLIVRNLHIAYSTVPYMFFAQCLFVSRPSAQFFASITHVSTSRAKAMVECWRITWCNPYQVVVVGMGWV